MIETAPDQERIERQESILRGLDAQKTYSVFAIVAGGAIWWGNWTGDLGAYNSVLGTIGFAGAIVGGLWHVDARRKHSAAFRELMRIRGVQ